MARLPRTSKKQLHALPNRLSLPGQDPLREAELLAKYTAYYEPDEIEEIWVAAIAYCLTSVEHQKASIAGFKAGCIREAYEAHRSEPHALLHIEQGFALSGPAFKPTGVLRSVRPHARSRHVQPRR